MARVIFDFYGTGLGIMEFPGYESGDILTFTAGNNVLTVYNAQQTGTLTFDISYSGASNLLIGAGSIIAVLAAMF